MLKTETITRATHISEMSACKMFPVAMSRITKQIMLAIAMPLKADVMKAFSEGSQAHHILAVYSTDCIDLGAVLLYS
jgi:hypothetical protein